MKNIPAVVVVALTLLPQFSFSQAQDTALEPWIGVLTDQQTVQPLYRFNKGRWESVVNGWESDGDKFNLPDLEQYPGAKTIDDNNFKVPWAALHNKVPKVWLLHRPSESPQNFKVEGALVECSGLTLTEPSLPKLANAPGYQGYPIATVGLEFAAATRPTKKEGSSTNNPIAKAILAELRKTNQFSAESISLQKIDLKDHHWIIFTASVRKNIGMADNAKIEFYQGIMRVGDAPEVWTKTLRQGEHDADGKGQGEITVLGVAAIDKTFYIFYEVGGYISAGYFIQEIKPEGFPRIIEGEGETFGCQEC